MTVRLLVTGDIHIGRRPTRLPASVDAAAYSCARMWEAITQRAVDERVDAVVLTGDVVDHDNRYFEAIGPLERGLRLLARHEIPTYAVAGNHDYDVLPQLADELGGEFFHLLGRGGVWESAVLECKGTPAIRFWGWSFPEGQVATSPLLAASIPSQADLPSIGILHCDLDSADSPYAPVTRDQLRAQPVALWLLGHIHRPSYVAASSGAGWLYPGSPQAMDPGESGMHGPWIIEFEPAGNVKARQLAMSRVRYEPLSVDLEGAESRDDLERRVTAKLRRTTAALASESGSLEHLLVRLTFSGATALCGQIAQFEEQLCGDLELSAGAATARIESVANDTRPAIDLEAMAQRRDPTGVLARLLLDLNAGRADDELQKLQTQSLLQMQRVQSAPVYQGIGDDAPPDLTSARSVLLAQGTLLLEALREQQHHA